MCLFYYSPGVLGNAKMADGISDWQATMQAKLGVKVVVLDPTPGCPASAVAVQIVGSFRDPAAVNQIAQLV